MKIEVQMSLCATRVGRVVLHVAGMLRDKHYLWHIKGIGRELIHA